MPSFKMPSFSFGGKAKVKKPKIDGSLSGSLSGSGPDIKVKGPKVKAPKGDVDVDLSLGGGADIDVKGPKVDVDLPKADVDLKVGGDVDIKGPKVKVCFHFLAGNKTRAIPAAFGPILDESYRVAQSFILYSTNP